MYVVVESDFEKFKKALNNLAFGSLLLQKVKSDIYFSSDVIYCEYAGYNTDWRDFIGYQNVLFYSYIKKLKHIIEFKGLTEIDYTEEELKSFLDRNIVFDIKIVVMNDNLIYHQIEKVKGLAAPLYKKVKDITSQETLTSIIKQELQSGLIELYVELLYLKALIAPKYEYDIDLSNKLLLNSDNILRTWRENEIY